MPEARLTAAVGALYAALPAGTGLLSPMRPWVGAHYEAPAPTNVRVLTIGINSYVSPKDEPGHPAWFPAWVNERAHRYFPTMQDEAARIGAALAARADNGQAYEGPDGLYATNAVKRFLPHRTGRHAHDVSAQWFDEGARVWREELVLLAAHGALPHAIVVFGAAAWSTTWRPLAALCEDDQATAFVAYRPMPREHIWYHRVNRIDVRDLEGRRRTMLLVRLDHPAARRRFVAATVSGRLNELLA